MSRDPLLLAECADLKHAVARFPTLDELRRAPEWPALEARLWRVLTTVRRNAPGAPPGPPRDPARLRLVQWNIEHGNRYEVIETALREHPLLRDPDIVSLNEVDLGMARAGVERIVVAAGGRANDEGLFGIALLSRWPIAGVRRVELPSPEQVQFDLERMLGRHVALIAEIERPGAPFVMVTVHLEVHRTRAYRAAQMRILLEALAGERRPIVLAGDLNSHTFDRGRPWDALFGAAVLTLTPAAALKRRLLHPDKGATREPVFDALREAGFAWEPFVDHTPTLALRLVRLGETRALFGPLAAPAGRALAWAESRAGLRLDWVAARGFRNGSGWTVTEHGGPGLASDHAPIVSELW